MTRNKALLPRPRNQRPTLVLACVILLALFIAPTAASAYDEKIPFRRYKHGFRSWATPDDETVDRHIFKEAVAQGDDLFANGSDTLIANPKKIAIIGECDCLPHVFMI